MLICCQLHNISSSSMQVDFEPGEYLIIPLAGSNAIAKTTAIAITVYSSEVSRYHIACTLDTMIHSGDATGAVWYDHGND